MASWKAGLKFALGTLSVYPVKVYQVDREVARQAMVLAPAVGAALGLVACVPLLLFDWRGSTLLGAALALGLIAVLTRGLHLDGLADLADGLGSGRPATQALDVMKRSDIGPFGVVTLLFTLLIQVAALSEAGPVALVTACATGRLALTWACTVGVPSARPDGLGAMVAGTVRRDTAALATLAVLITAGLLGLLWAAITSTSLLLGAFLPLIAALAGLGAAAALLWHAHQRLGGITGDVLGALVETTTATTLVVYALFS